MYLDEYIFTTEERFFNLNETLTGIMISHQTAYPCTNDSIIYNSTSLIKLASGDTISVYTPCSFEDFNTGDNVMISSTSYNKDFIWAKREIIRQFPKKSVNYPYWECISCKYKNTIGTITLANIK